VRLILLFLAPGGKDKFEAGDAPLKQDLELNASLKAVYPNMRKVKMRYVARPITSKAKT
jgi:hypothetical protein